MEMKKYLFLSAFAYSSLVASAPEYLRYMGVDAGRTLSKTVHFDGDSDKEIRHKPEYVGVYNGYRIGQHAAFEFGAFSSRALNTSRSHRIGQTHIDGLHMGFVFFLPVTNRFEALPGMGVAQVVTRVRTPEVFIKEKGIVPRLMFGAQFKITDRLRLRGSFAWHRMGGVYSHMIHFSQCVHASVGLNYSFAPSHTNP